MNKAVILVCFVLVLIHHDASGVNPVTRTPWGRIEGRHTQDEQGNKLDAYRGIPFAKPPVGHLRFKKPVRYPDINGTFNASTYGPACLQPNQGFPDSNSSVYGDEDCLTLDVYVPTNETTQKKAVMIWIYGGGYFVGFGKWYDGTPLTTVGDVIVVTIQYRLGIFGFFSTMDHASRGNYGLWDQLLAIKWVRRNIAAFGGDTSRITIIGESAGASSVGFLTLHPNTKGMFQRAILQSGSVTSSWSFDRHPLVSTNIAAKQLGCDRLRNSVLMVNCLRTKSVSELLFVTPPPGGDINALRFTPVVDGDFIVDEPQKLLQSPDSSSAFSSCDIMLGVNNNEGADMYGNAVYYDHLYNTSNAAVIQTHSSYRSQLSGAIEGMYGEVNKEMIDVAIFEYMYPQRMDSPRFNYQPIFDTKTDSSFLAPAVQFARIHASRQGRTYLYIFDHDPEFTLPPEETLSRGMHHAYDLYYTFGFDKIMVEGMAIITNYTQREMHLSVTFRKMLTQFAKSGNPNSALTGHLRGHWPEFNSTAERYLAFSNHMVVKDNVAHRRVALWLELLPQMLESKHRNQPSTKAPVIPALIG